MNKFIPRGTLLVKFKNEKRLYSVGDLRLTNELSIGQLFLAMATLEDKKTSEYGSKWPSFSTKKDEFKKIETELNKSTTDYEKLCKVCAHLGTNVPEIVPNEQIELNN